MIFSDRQPKQNPNPWHVTTTEGIDQYASNAEDLESNWLSTHCYEQICAPVTTSPANTDTPKRGSLILIEDNQHQYTLEQDEPTKKSLAMFVVLSDIGFNSTMHTFWGFQVLPFKYDDYYLSEPAFEAFVDAKNEIDGTINKMDLKLVSYMNYKIVKRLTDQQLNMLLFDLGNIFGVNELN